MNDYVVIAAEDGLVIQQSIRNLPVVLAAQFGAGESIGTALRLTRTAAEWLVYEPVVGEAAGRLARRVA